MESVYDSGFIDTAEGDALDLVVSILGIKRKEPTEATGYVTFIKETNPPEIINNEIILQDGREIYELKVKPVIKILSVIGDFNGEKHSFSDEKDYVLDSNSIRWLEGGDRPDLKKEATLEYSSYQNIMIPKGTIVSTLPKKGEAELTF